MIKRLKNTLGKIKTSFRTGFLPFQSIRKGSLLLEAMMAVVVFGLFMTASYTTLITGQEGTRNGSMRIRGVNYTLQGLEVVRSIVSQDGGYDLLTPGQHGFTIDPNNGTWVLSGTTLERFGYTTTLFVSDLSDSTKKIDVTSTWKFGYLRSGTTSVSTVISNWQEAPGVGNWSVITQTGSWVAGRQRNFTGMYAYNGYLYIANEGGTFGKGLTILNITNPTNPVEVAGTFAINSNVFSPVAKDNILYVAVGATNDLRAYQITDPSTLNGATTPVATVNLPGGPDRARALAIHEDTLLVGALGSGGQDELYAYSIATGGTLTFLDSLNISGDPTIYNIDIRDDYAYLAGASANMYIVDVSDPRNLSFLNSRLMGYAQATGVRVFGTGFYTTMLNGLDEFTMRTGSSGIPSGALVDLYGTNIGGNANGLDLDPLGCYAFIASGDGSKELQVRNPNLLSLPEEGSFNINNTGEGRAVEYDIVNDRVYLATASGVYLFTPGASGRCGQGLGSLLSGGGSYSCPPGYSWNAGLQMCLVSSGASSSVASSSSVAPLTFTVTATNGAEDGGDIAYSPGKLLAAFAPLPIVVGGSNALITFTANRPVPSNTTITYTITGTATNGVDYSTLPGSIVMTSGTTSVSENIYIDDDLLVEGNETVLITITSVSQGTIGTPNTATANIQFDNDPAFISATAHADLSEPTTNGSVTFTLDNARRAQDPLSFTYSVGGTATSGSDYTALSGTATIGAGNTSVTVPISVLNDPTIESGETIVVTVTSGAGYSVGSDPTETIDVISDDAATPAISATAHTDLAEPSTNGSFTLRVDGGANVTTPVTVNYSIAGSATSGSDYTALSGTATIGAGTNTVVIPVNVLNDSAIESNETIILTVTSGVGYTVGADSGETADITSDDFAISATAHTDLAEPTTNGSVTFTLDGGITTPTARTFSYSVAGTATSGSDYTALSGTATIGAGNSSITVPITIIDDGIVESGETIIITVTAGVGYTVGADSSEAVDIVDNESSNIIVSASSNGTEGGSNGSFTIGIQGGALAPSPLTVNYTVNAASTSTNGTDYTTLSGTATIGAGSNSTTIAVTITNDTIVEGTETVIINLSGVPVGYTIGTPSSGTINITDNDSAAVSASAQVNLAEPSTNGSITLSLDGAMTTKNALPITLTIGGTATTTADYTGLTTSATIPAGLGSVTVPITVVNDLVVESSETIIVTVVVGAGYTVGTTPSRTINITDNDSAAVSASASLNLAEPTTNGSVTFSLDGGMTTQNALAITFTRGGTATSGSDYSGLSTTATIPAGLGSVTVPISVIDDSSIEGNETIVVTVTLGAGYSVGATAGRTINITDNDVATPAIIVSSSANGTEGGSNGSFTIGIQGGALAPSPLTVNYTVSVASTATSGSDYTALSGTATIGAGANSTTVPVTITNDSVIESTETVIITLSSVPGGYTIGTPSSGTVSITDNDTATVRVSSSVSLAEPTTNGSVTFALPVGFTTQNALTVNFSRTGTATFGSDYSGLGTTATIPANANSVTVPINIIDDFTVEGPETVIVTLTTGSYTIGTPSSATVNITDNDVASSTASSSTASSTPITPFSPVVEP